MSPSFEAGAFVDRPLAELFRALDAHLEQPAALEAAGELLEERVIHLLRSGSLEEIGDEALSLVRFLQSGPGATWARTAPERHGAWSVLGRLLVEAGEKRGPGAIQAVLRSHKSPVAKMAIRTFIDTTSGIGLRVADLAERGGDGERSGRRGRVDVGAAVDLALAL